VAVVGHWRSMHHPARVAGTLSAAYTLQLLHPLQYPGYVLCGSSSCVNIQAIHACAMLQLCFPVSCPLVLHLRLHQHFA
jgi:hypothetical protein